MKVDPRRRGFTLLEVAISVAILAVALSAVFSSQIVALRTGVHSRMLTTATLLARCKMGEIEEQLAQDGFSTNDESGEDECCEDAEVDGFRCEYRIERIVLPEAGDEEDPTALTEGEEGEEGDETPSLDSLLAGTASPAAGGDLANLAFSYAFPIMKPRIEEQVRRVTVEVHFNEGQRDRMFDVVQYVVQEPTQVQNNQQDPEGT